jgi:hypothetical protein
LVVYFIFKNCVSRPTNYVNRPANYVNRPTHFVNRPADQPILVAVLSRRVNYVKHFITLCLLQNLCCLEFDL